MDAEHTIEADLEALLYVTIAVLSFKRSSTKGEHWLSWTPAEWEQASTMHSKSFRERLASRTRLSQEVLDMAALWKKHLLMFRIRKAALVEDDDRGHLEQERNKLMAKVVLCVSRAAIALG